MRSPVVNTYGMPLQPKMMIRVKIRWRIALPALSVTSVFLILPFIPKPPKTNAITANTNGKNTGIIESLIPNPK